MSLKFLSFTTCLLLLATIFFGYRTYKQDKVAYLSGKNIVYKQGDVLGISTDEASVAIDFARQVSVASPLIFGGAHAPRLTDTKAWDQIESAGVTAIRLDFFLDRYIPSKFTVDQYKQNVGDVQNPKLWNQTEINNVKGVYQQAHKRNMKVMGILAYNVKWLSLSDTNYGVPKDWAVFDDLAQKSYRIFRDDLDYLEIWNEPDMDVFWNMKNSGLKKEDAYYTLVQHAIADIRKVDAEINDGKRMKIGIGVTAIPTNTGYIEKVLADPNLRKEVDFVSYHNYEHLKEPSNLALNKVLAKYNLSNLPTFVTEWAHAPSMKKADSYVLEDVAIPYAGGKLIDFLKMGIAGANYFSMQPIIPDSPRGDEGYLGFYTGQGSSLNMLPIIKTWSLMSKTMGLGKGDNKIYAAEQSDEKVIGVNNSINDLGIVLSNPSYQMKTFNLTLYNLPLKSDVVAEAYVASGDLDGKSIIGTTLVKSRADGNSLKVLAPANSVVGIKLRQATWKDKLPF